MIMDDPGSAIFEADAADEYRLSFTVPDPTSLRGRRPLMTMRCFEEDKMRGSIVWLGEHQHLWPEWRVIAQARGGNHLSAVIIELMAKEARQRFGSDKYLCEMCLGASATRGGGSTDIELTVLLTTRSVNVITHAFQDVHARDAFMDHLASEVRTLGSVELAEIGLLRGRDALGRKLDEIARERLRDMGSTIH